MPKMGDNIHIPLPESEGLESLLAVKPAKDLNRPGAKAKEARRQEKSKSGEQKAP
jgi:hypothetical protein